MITIGGLDLETTGLDQEKGHRIIEVAIGLYKYETGSEPRQVGKIWNKLIDPKRSIDPGAQAVHGISLADLVGCDLWEDVAPTVVKLLKACDILVIHNVPFDAPFLAGELVRIGLEVPEVLPFCTMENGRGASPMGTPPSLQKLCWAMDVDYNPEDAHRADYDVDRMMQVYFAGIKRGLFVEPDQALKLAA